MRGFAMGVCSLLAGGNALLHLLFCGGRHTCSYLCDFENHSVALTLKGIFILTRVLTRACSTTLMTRKAGGAGDEVHTRA